MKKIMKRFIEVVIKNETKILPVVAIVAIGVLVVTVHKDTNKASKILEQKKQKYGRELTRKEKIISSWKCYIPSAVTSVVAIGSIVRASVVHTKHIKAISDTLSSVNELSKSVTSKDEEKVQKTNTVITGNSKNKVMFMDGLSGRLFESTINDVDKIINMMNRELIHGDGQVTVNEWYEYLGISEVAKEERSWSVEDGDIEALYDAVIEDDIPVICVELSPTPEKNKRFSW